MYIFGYYTTGFPYKNIMKSKVYICHEGKVRPPVVMSEEFSNVYYSVSDGIYFEPHHDVEVILDS
jgi:hypothetical protein